MEYRHSPLQYYPVDANSQAAGLRDSLLTPLHEHDRRDQRKTEEAFRNAQLQRETSRDVRNDERERVSQAQRAREIQMNDRRAGQREDLYALSENRRERVDQLNRQHLKQAEHEKLIQDLYNASNTGDPRAVQYAIDALNRAGYPVEELQHTAAVPSSPAAPPVAAVDTAPTPAPVSKADAQTSSQLDQADAQYSRGLGISAGLGGLPYKQAMGQANSRGLLGVKQVAPDRWLPIPKDESDRDSAANGSPKKKSKDAELDRQLSDIDSKYTKGLAGSSVSPWLPGRSPLRRAPTADVAQSDAMLDPADPYNQIVK